MILAVLYYGSVLASANEITPGNLSSFLIYAGYTAVSMGGMHSFYTDLNRGLGATTRLWEIIDRPSDILSGKYLLFLFINSELFYFHYSRNRN